jgi:soluble lytic murein transglycosylase
MLQSNPGHYQISLQELPMRARQPRRWLSLLILPALLLSACSSKGAEPAVGRGLPAATANSAAPSPSPAAADADNAAANDPGSAASDPSPPLGTGVLPTLSAGIQGESPAALEALMAAREAMQRKQWSVLALMAPQARSGLLGQYAQYWMLRYQMWNPQGQGLPVADLQTFLNTYRDSYLGDKLRGDWILSAARYGDFQTVLSLGPVKSSNAQIDCARIQARHMTGAGKASAAEAVQAFRPGTWCWSLYDQLVADRVLGWNELDPQLRDALEDNKLSDARRYAAYLFDAQEMKTYDAMMKDPMKWLVRQPRPPRTRVETELDTLALARIARKDLDASETYFQREWSASLPRADAAWVRGQYALIAALNLDPRADEWYRAIGQIRLSEYNQAWKVRAGLRRAPIDWRYVVTSIEAMTPGERNDASWVYWHARGMAALGRTETARQEYASIAGQFNFYGQLASEELGRKITLPPKAAPVSSEELAMARANPGLQRAIALFQLGWRGEAVPEWNFALRDMNDRQLLAAAELARGQNIYDRVVNTSDRTETQFDFTQRYIAPFSGRVTARAKEIELDPAWVYGLIRQESRFIMDARSSAGASGLMQLMPGTAKWVATKIGMTNFTPASVADFDTNTILGTSYLSMVLQNLDGSQVLASAGYNAGPKRPLNWRATLVQPVEGAIFAETIPFNETRTYVKNVMSNATYYAALFSGQPQSLKQRLGQIDPGTAQRTALP